MGKWLEGTQKGLKAKIHFHLPRGTHKKYQFGKLQAMMAYMDTGLKTSLQFTVDWL